ncbi:MAG: SCO family protein, partial [bacterium]
MKNNILLTLVVTLLFIASTLHAKPSPPSDYQLPAGGDFELQGADKTYHLSDFSGKVVLLFFGYTHCPDICPTTLSTVSMALKKLPIAIRDQIQIVFISVDPNRDTPKHLDTYTAYFDDHILGVTGTREAIDKVVAQYGAKYEIVPVKSKSGYLVNHSAYLYAIDRQGKLMGLLKDKG